MQIFNFPGTPGANYVGECLLTGSETTQSFAITELDDAPGWFLAELPNVPGDYSLTVSLGEVKQFIGYETVDPELIGTVQASPVPTAEDFKTDLPQTQNNFWNGSVCRFITGALRGKSLRIANYLGSSKVLEFSEAFPVAPAVGDKFQIIGRIQ